MLIVSIIWGTTFVAQSIAMKYMGPIEFTAIRFILGSFLILPLAFIEGKRLKNTMIEVTKKDVLSWIFLGLLLFCGSYFQQTGLTMTTVTNAGFLTGLYVPMVPILSWFIDQRKIHFSTWFAVFGSVIGIYLLSNAEFRSLNKGDGYIIMSVIFWAFHVYYIGKIASQKNINFILAYTQFIICGLFSLIFTLFMEDISFNHFILVIPALLYCSCLSVGLAFTLQIIAQRHTSPTDAAIILSAETLFAALAGAILLGERLSVLQNFGCALIFLSIIFVQIMPDLEQYFKSLKKTL